MKEIAAQFDTMGQAESALIRLQAQGATPLGYTMHKTKEGAVSLRVSLSEKETFTL